MRYLIISDIHANQTALEAVLRDAKMKGWKKVIFLGDAVGYYTEPEPVLNTLKTLETEVCILGNHDKLLLDIVDSKADFSDQRAMVTDILQKHSQQITAENVTFLRSFQPQKIASYWQAVHGSLTEQWDYLKSISEAEANMPLMQARVCFVGHTHVPVIYAFIKTPKGGMWRAISTRNNKLTYRIPPKALLFVNPGSVGQPRDGNPNTSYAIFDEDAELIELYRVEYDNRKVQRMVIDQGYPHALAERLEIGN